ncbi:16S rRNA (guanine(966)-N(2))-methyltransferase RsmD [Coralloluteibacterium stylophorae]|uniref:16S rRNA (Guanine(966)-N(2))-methyltransferase RsmD n=1 Tax=Coralloluteibacterium stylophorae TaxID=1776034 RepID=A0A8J7VRA4_9GAMM|nr:16S rRNA (guanine(966)-N(2))-methyltransferase RsmD [Coralloluteibacterium stylophorae]MBS7456172.1 16S rRNA (guanine(966)-N(2))-methyltransferase RsmD [Coralloluteibacterium stylophorae]
MNARARQAGRARPGAGPGSVRIVGGRWRGTRLAVGDAPGLRPSSDRVRETLFNWLQGRLAGARVVDAFAGSGALGLEAASRGAARVTLVERDPALVASLRATVARLEGAGARVEVVGGDALAWLEAQPPASIDLALLDPPFAADLLPRTIALLRPRLADDALVYVECGREQDWPVPAEWRLHREGSTRDVRFALLRAGPAGAARIDGPLESPGPGPQEPTRA